MRAAAAQGAERERDGAAPRVTPREAGGGRGGGEGWAGGAEKVGRK